MAIAGKGGAIGEWHSSRSGSETYPSATADRETMAVTSDPIFPELFVYPSFLCLVEGTMPLRTLSSQFRS